MKNFSQEIKIHNSVKEQATECSKNFDCLTNKEHVYCQVESCVSNKVHFVRCLHEQKCNYKLPFADTFVCTCPVRKEIYNLYRI